MKRRGLNEAKVIALFTFVRRDVVLCSAASVVGEWGIREFIWGNLAVIRTVSGSWKFVRNSVFS